MPDERYAVMDRNKFSQSILDKTNDAFKEKQTQNEEEMQETNKGSSSGDKWNHIGYKRNLR